MEQSTNKEALHWDWYLEKSIRGQSMAVNQVTKDFQQRLWPAAESYLSPLSPLFLTQVIDLNFLNSNKHWMVRDGLIPLLMFFKKFPRPTGLQSVLYIDAEFAAFVPGAWKERVEYYNVISNNKKYGKKLFIFGMMWSVYTDLTHLERALSEFDFEKYEEVEAYLPARASHWDESEQSYHAKFMLLLSRKVNKEIKLVEHNFFHKSSDYSQYTVLDLNQKFSIADNAMAHRLLSKGAMTIGDQVPLVAEQMVPLSLYHSIEIGKVEQSKADLQKFAQKRFSLNRGDMNQLLFSIVSGAAYQGLPWGEWFADWEKT